MERVGEGREVVEGRDRCIVCEWRVGIAEGEQ